MMHRQPQSHLRDRIVRALLALVLVISTALSAHVISELHDHACEGERCPACQTMATAQRMLASGATPAAPQAAAFLAVVALALTARLPWLALEAQTPVGTHDQILC